MSFPAHTFRAYDIRGIATGEQPEITPQLAFALGRAFAGWLAEAENEPNPRVVVGRDNRATGEALAVALAAGLVAGGAHVTEIGYATSPYLYFAVCHGDFVGGINVTASHNPAEYNGFKIVRRGAVPVAGDDLQILFSRLAPVAELPAVTPEQADFRAEYFARLSALAPLTRPLKVVLDCGNGTAGYFAADFFRQLGAEVVELYCDPDPTFPNHLANPEEVETLHDLQAKVVAEGADLGLAFDGDGDRAGVVDERGQVVASDRVLVLLARDLLARQPGATVIFDLKCSQVLAAEITVAGGRPMRWKTGHSFIKQKMRETGASLAGEVSGHFFFGEDYFGVDDGLLAAAKVASIFSRLTEKPSAYFAALPTTFTTPELKLPTPDAVKFAVVNELKNSLEKYFGVTQSRASAEAMQHAKVSQKTSEAGQRPDECFLAQPTKCGAPLADAIKIETLDGVRVAWPDGAWGLVRASNTSPYLTARFEATSAERLAEIKQLFATELATHSAVDATALL